MIDNFAAARLLSLIVVMCVPSSVLGQQTSGKTSELTDGLLNLLGKPSESESPSITDAAKENGSASGVDIEARSSLADGSSNSIHQSMILAADSLRQRATSRTQQLQSQILSELDELIQNAEERKQNSERESSQSRRSSQQQEQQEQGSRPKVERGDHEQDPTAKEEQRPGGSPGQTGAVADSNVQLSDPKALQESVWGQLPEQVRKQMQSRMVEQFLPSYQLQIEAYFKALLRGEE